MQHKAHRQISKQHFVATMHCVVLKSRVKKLAMCCCKTTVSFNVVDALLYDYNFQGNNVALKIAPGNITLAGKG